MMMRMTRRRAAGGARSLVRERISLTTLQLWTTTRRRKKQM